MLRPWTRRFRARRWKPGLATPCCSRRPARASTCSATIRTGARCFVPRCRGSRMAEHTSGSRSQIPEYDASVLWASVLLLTFGLVMVYSASIALAETSRFTGGKPTYFLERQALFLAASVVAGMLVFQVPMRLWQQAAPWLFVITAGLLAIVLVPALGRE